MKTSRLLGFRDHQKSGPLGGNEILNAVPMKLPEVIPIIAIVAAVLVLIPVGVFAYCYSLYKPAPKVVVCAVGESLISEKRIEVSKKPYTLDMARRSTR